MIHTTQTRYTIVEADFIQHENCQYGRVCLTLEAFDAEKDRISVHFRTDDQKSWRALIEGIGGRSISDTSELVGLTIYGDSVAKINPVKSIQNRIVIENQKPSSSAASVSGEYVYVIECVDDDGDPVGLCKIGIARDPQKRLKELATASPHALKLHYCRTAKSRKEANIVESEAHTNFAEFRQNGEWFKVDSYTATNYVNDNINSRAAA